MARLDIAYDGTEFRGYARQPDVRTVQGELETALSIIFQRPIETAVAGRTDAGVHAFHQVVSFPNEEAMDGPRIVHKLNQLLSSDIVVHAASDTRPEFHARFSATSRTYRYFILNTTDRDPQLRRTHWHVPESLDLDVMNEGVAHLLGRHDFVSLCRKAEGKTRVRTVLSSMWSRQADTVELMVTAVAFCHQMVRSIVALSVDIGIGKIDAARVPEIIEAQDRNCASGAAPPHGLTLWRVDY